MLLWMTVAAAKCASGWVSISEAPVSLDAPRLVVEFSGLERDRIDGFRPVLAKGRDRVTLRASERIDGRNGVTQVVYEPDGTLGEGTWTLHARGRVYEPAKPISVSALSDEKAWSNGPVAVRTSVEQFGCGPAVHAHVDLHVPNTWVEVKLDGPGEPERAWVRTDGKGELVFGHGMCGGLFTMQEGDYTGTLGRPGQPDLRVAFEL